MIVRNPFTALFITLLETALLVPLLLLPILAFLWLDLPREVPLFYAVAAVAVAGAFAGRTGTFAWAALAASFLGGFVGFGTFTLLVPPADLLFTTIHAAIAGLASWASAVQHMGRVTPEIAIEGDRQRRCRMCGSKVGTKAIRCWSCRASLQRIT